MIATDLERILAWADSRVPGLRESLRRGATDAQIEALEKTIGAALPADVVALYRLHDGQVARPPTGLIYGMTLMSLESATHDWTSWRDIATPDMEDSCAGLMKSFPANAIELRYHHPGWIPLTRDGSGNHTGVDLAPGRAGTRGQFIIFGRDENEKLQISTSLGAFFHWYANELEAGNFVVEIDEDEDVDPVVERFGIKTPPHHFHDAVREIRRTCGPLQ
jgi:cell wall assembly regulator SMI1